MSADARDPAPPAPAPEEPSPSPSPSTKDAASASPGADRRIERRVRIACGFSLLALGLITWSLLDPRPLPVIAAMTLGQAIGTLSLLFFVGSILLDLRARRILSKLDRR